MSNEPKPDYGLSHLIGKKVCSQCRGFKVVYWLSNLQPDGKIKPVWCSRCNGKGGF